MPGPAPVPNVTPGGAAACHACPRAAFFQVRVEWPPGQPGHSHRRANACASHLVEVIEQLRAWARDSHLTGGWLTVLAIDPYALPRLAALGIPAPGFAFYSAPLSAAPNGRPGCTRPGAAARHEDEADPGAAPAEPARSR
jgi:hypothetical protein